VPTWLTLEELGLFDFSEATDALDVAMRPPDDFDPTTVPWTIVSDENYQMSRDLSLLGAAGQRVLLEMCALEHPGVPVLPIQVQAADARSAFVTYGCALGLTHYRQDLGVLDLEVMLPQSADVRKLRAVGVESATMLLDNFEGFVSRMTDLYRSSASGYSREVAEQGWIALQGAVWLATILCYFPQVDAEHRTEAFLDSNDQMRQLRAVAREGASSGFAESGSDSEPLPPEASV
jgi:hypothetical protein